MKTKNYYSNPWGKNNDSASLKKLVKDTHKQAAKNIEEKTKSVHYFDHTKNTEKPENINQFRAKNYLAKNLAKR
jgi:hypothetical protein